MMRRSIAGQSLSEYGLIGFCVVVLSIAAFVMLGGSLDSTLGRLRASLLDNVSASAVAATINDGIGGAASGGTDTSGTATMVLPTGEVVTVTTSGAFGADVMTTGANGATTMALAQLQTLTQQLQASGELTPDQVNALIALANQGHRIAQIEKMIEDAVSMSANPTAVYTMTFQLDGKMYTGRQMIDMLGFENQNQYVNLLTDVELLETTSKGAIAMAETGSFINLYQAALQSGAMDDPAIAGTVKELSMQVTFLSQLTKEAYLYRADHLKREGLHVGQAAVEELHRLNGDLADMFAANQGMSSGGLSGGTISGTTHGNSGQICGAGNGQDSGTACSP